MKAFERQLTVDAPKNLNKIESLVGKDEAKQRKVKEYKNTIENLKTKWNKSKSEFQSNGNLKNAVVIQNSLR